MCWCVQKRSVLPPSVDVLRTHPPWLSWEFLSSEHIRTPTIVGILEKQWASYQIRKVAGRACVGMPGTFSLTRLQRKPLVSDPGMHHGTCVTHVPWCMSGSLTRGGGENVPSIPGAWASRNLAYLVRGPWCVRMHSRLKLPIPVGPRNCWLRKRWGIAYKVKTVLMCKGTTLTVWS